MNRKEVAELLPILKAFSEGKEIEAIYKGTKSPWFKVEEMFFDKGTIFRIKSEPKYRPFKDIKECLAEMQKHEPFGWVKDKTTIMNIARIKGTYIVFSHQESYNYTFEKVFKDYTFFDGAKFGIKEEQL